MTAYTKNYPGWGLTARHKKPEWRMVGSDRGMDVWEDAEGKQQRRPRLNMQTGLYDKSTEPQYGNIPEGYENPMFARAKAKEAEWGLGSDLKPGEKSKKNAEKDAQAHRSVKDGQAELWAYACGRDLKYQDYDLFLSEFLPEWQRYKGNNAVSESLFNKACTLVEAYLLTEDEAIIQNMASAVAGSEVSPNTERFLDSVEVATLGDMIGSVSKIIEDYPEIIAVDIEIGASLNNVINRLSQLQFFKTKAPK